MLLFSVDSLKDCMPLTVLESTWTFFWRFLYLLLYCILSWYGRLWEITLPAGLFICAGKFLKQSAVSKWNEIGSINTHLGQSLEMGRGLRGRLQDHQRWVKCVCVCVCVLMSVFAYMVCANCVCVVCACVLLCVCVCASVLFMVCVFVWCVCLSVLVCVVCVC